MEVRLEPPGQLHAAAVVALGQVLVEAPAPFRDAEQQEHQRAAGQQKVAHQEILGVHNVLARQELHAAEQVEAQQAGEAGNQNDEEVDDDRFFPIPAEIVHAAAENIFKHGDDSGEAGEGHKQEEQRAPQPSAGHGDKEVGQREEDQVGAGVRLDAEAEAGREDDQARTDGHEGVQPADADGFSAQGVIPGHEAAEDLHAGNAQAQGEEGLVHGGGDDLADALLRGAAEIRQQIEGETLAGAGQRNAAHHQHHDQQKQARHHPFADPLQTLLDAEAADAEARHYRYYHPNG